MGVCTKVHTSHTPFLKRSNAPFQYRPRFAVPYAPCRTDPSLCPFVLAFLVLESLCCSSAVDAPTCLPQGTMEISAGLLHGISAPPTAPQAGTWLAMGGFPARRKRPKGLVPVIGSLDGPGMARPVCPSLAVPAKDRTATRSFGAPWSVKKLTKRAVRACAPLGHPARRASNVRVGSAKARGVVLMKPAVSPKSARAARIWSPIVAVMG